MPAITHLDTSDICTCPQPAQSDQVWRQPFQFAVAVARTIGCRIARHRQRQDLAVLDDRLLADIGVTREAALHEAGKPFLA